MKTSYFKNNNINLEKIIKFDPCRPPTHVSRRLSFRFPVLRTAKRAGI